MTTDRDVEKFKRLLRSAEGMLYRRDGGQLTGRNDASSQATLRMRFDDMSALVKESDAVCEALDTNEKLAARYHRAERRWVGLPV